MTGEQFERWKDFASRMARTCFTGRRRPTSTWIIEQVDDWFAGLWQREWEAWSSWDDGISDAVSEWADSPAFFCPTCHRRATTEMRHPGYMRWREGCTCDEIEPLAYEKWQDQWMGPVYCCLRAGSDFACEPSAGVIGFTAGDVRRMYPEGVPEWVFPEGERLHYWLTDKLNGTFADLPDSAGIVL